MVENRKIDKMDEKTFFDMLDKAVRLGILQKTVKGEILISKEFKEEMERCRHIVTSKASGSNDSDKAMAKTVMLAVVRWVSGLTTRELYDFTAVLVSYINATQERA